VRVLLTGSEGYIGSVLGPVLMREGHDVVGLDTGFHRAGWLVNGVDGAPAWHNKDTRHVDIADLRGFDAIVHLADLSNDPVGELNADVTHDINHRATVRLAELAKAAGLRRFVYMSSCSIYGASGDSDSTEDSPVQPLTAYARCKVLVEADLKALADDSFSPTYLRNATAFGVSPRMRFDLVVNNLAGHAWTEQVIRMESDGSPWRPFVHIRDISRAVACALGAPDDLVHDEAFNVGDNAQNYQIREIAEVVSRTFPGCELTVGDSSADQRNYRASFDKIHDTLPGFRCEHDVAAGAQELLDAFSAIELSKELFGFRGHTRIKQIQHLLDTGQIDDWFYWTNGNAATRRRAA
jgi:nucleoside-diphosphate-sugar epimerase